MFAFTLAEVLITLGIIGVVAALTLPTLIGSYRNMVLENQFKKSYSVLSQALMRTTLELGADLHANYIPGEPEGWAGAVEFRETFFKQLINTGASLKQMNFLGKDWSSYSGVKETYMLGLGAVPGYLAMVDGSTVTVLKNNSRLNVLVDINGTKKPNRTGYDIFLFVVDDKSDRLVSWSSNKIYCNSEDKTSVINGRSCTYFAMMNQNPYDSTKKYFKSLKW